MARIKKEIKAVRHLPDNKKAIRQFEKKICDFYAAQVEQRLRSLPKSKKLEVLDILLSDCAPQKQKAQTQNKPASILEASL